MSAAAADLRAYYEATRWRITRYPGRVKQGHPTIDHGNVYRGMLVGFDDASARTCTRSMAPLQPVRARDMREACAKMSEVLPLIVLLSEDAAATGTSELADLAGACGAEVITLALPVDGATLGPRILEALRKSEARRVPR